MKINPDKTKDVKRVLGFWTSTSLVVGNMIGSGIFLLPSALAVYGGISIFGWMFTTIGAILLLLDGIIKVIKDIYVLRVRIS